MGEAVSPQSLQMLQWLAAEVRQQLGTTLRKLEDALDSGSADGPVDQLDDTVGNLAEIARVLEVASGDTELSLLAQDVASTCEAIRGQPLSEQAMAVLGSAVLNLSRSFDALSNPTSHQLIRNDLRALRGAPLVTEEGPAGEAFRAGLERLDSVVGGGSGLSRDTLQQAAQTLRQAADSFTRAEVSEESLFELRKAFSLLADKGARGDFRAIGYAGLALFPLEPDRIGQLPHALITQLDRAAALLENPGQRAPGLVRNLLAYVRLAKPGRERSKLMELFQLRDLEADSTTTVTTTTDAEATRLVAVALTQDLAQLQESLEQYFLSGDLTQGLPATQRAQAAETVDRVIATLQVLDLEEAEEWGQRAREAIDRLAEEGRDPGRESIYLELAEALIQLNERLERWASESTGQAVGGSGLQAARSGLARNARQSLLEQIARLEERHAANADGVDQGIGSELTELASVLRYIPLTDLATAIDAVAARMANEQPLAASDWEQVADVLMATDYYLENLTAEVPVPIDALQARALKAAAGLAPEVRTAAKAVEEVALPKIAGKPGRRDEAQKADAGPQEIELDELVDIFLEEAEEVHQANELALQRWQSGDVEGLVDLRRGFHTLKGGGRMVGATALGEFSWAVENLLNRVIERTIDESPQVAGLAMRAVAEVSRLIAQLRQGIVTDTSDSAALADLCNRAARGETIDLPSQPEAAMEQATPADEAKSVAVASDESTEVETAAETSGDMAVEPDLFATFLAEAGRQRDVVRAAIAESENPGRDQLQALSLALHNLANSMHVAELEKFERATTPVERWVNLCVSRSGGLDAETVSLLEAWVEGLGQSLTALESGDTTAIGTAADALLKVAGPFEKLFESRRDGRTATLADERRRRFGAMRSLMSGGLDAILAPAWKNPQPADLIEQSFLKAFLEDLRDIRDISRDSNLEEIEPLAEHLLALVARLHQEPESFNDAIFALLQDAREELLRALDAVASGQVIPHASATVLASLAPYRAAIADSGAEAAEREVAVTDGGDESDIDEPELAESQRETGAPFEPPLSEITGVFLGEAEELIASIGEHLAAWKRAPEELDHANELHRALHTLKGGARVAGMAALGTLSHEFESLIIDHQVAGRTDAAFFERAYELFDQVSTRIESALAKAQAEQEDSSPAADTAPAPLDREEKLDAGVQTLVSIHQPEQERVFTVAPTFESGLQKQFAEQQVEGRGQEDIRVNTDLLDKMVNLSGESITVRGRLENRLNELEFNLEELESTIGRVKSLVRRLDAETEAQIEFRREQIAESDELKEFDPLEMDRYSHLQQLSRQLQESVSDLNDLRLSMGRGTRDFSSLLIQAGRLNSEINEGLVRSRMVRFARIVPRLERICRQVSTELDKQVELKVLNVEGEVDRKILDQILAPLEHMLRNAIDHGIESAADRRKVGKPERGTIYLSVGREGGYMVVRIADDGRGLDAAKIRQQALDRKLIEQEQADSLTDRELYQYIFESGLSTADALTEISGRGVGMDVVRDVVRRLGGRVDVDSQVGEGTVIRLNLPFTLSVNRTLSVRCGEQNFAVPLVALEALVRLPLRDLRMHYDNPGEKFHYAGAEFDFVYLGDMLGVSTRPDLDELDVPSLPLVLFRTAGRRVAVLVDEIIGTQELVIKSLGTHFKDVRGLSGAAIVNDGRVVVTLDINRLVEVWSENGDLAVSPEDKAEAGQPRIPTVMVVDDSVTVRKFTDRFLTRAGFAVLTARDGVEALRALHDQRPDLILLDVEMPRMDGFELLGILRSTSEFADLPVILITSRTGEKHRERGLALGAQGYFGKPYREPDLLAAIANLIDVGSAQLGTGADREGVQS